MKYYEAFVNRCQIYLNEQWGQVNELTERSMKDFLGNEFNELKSDIAACLQSRTKSYHYVLPTQILSKAVEPTRDCRSLQASYNKPGAFDARTIAHKVIVPFDKENHNVLGGSNEPYVNNPLRCPGVTLENEPRQKNKEDWRRLVNVLEIIENENNPKFTSDVFRQVLLEIYKMLSEVKVIYPTPSRVSLEKTVELLKLFLSKRSGGERVESVTTALFKEIAQRFGLFDDIKRGKINAADLSSGMAADIECYSQGKLALLVEVKDAALTITHLTDKLDIARAGKIREILFVVEKGTGVQEDEKIGEKVRREFISGQNVYITSFLDFSYSIFILFGEEGRGSFLRRIGDEMDRVNSEIIHRKTWAKLLREI